MLRFKQFLIEEEQTLNPRRQNFPEGEEGDKQYSQALRDTALKQKAEGDKMRSSGEKNYKILGNIETGLKVAETVTDAALTAGAVAVPGVGTMLNATVKGIKAQQAVNDGDFVKAGLYAADAALPALGNLAKTASAGGKIAQAVKPVGELAKDVTNFVKNPIADLGKRGAQETISRLSQTGPAKAVIDAGTKALQSSGLSSQAIQVGTKTAVTTGTKIAGQKTEKGIQNTGFNTKQFTS